MIISDADMQRFDLEKVDEIYYVQNSLIEGKPHEDHGCEAKLDSKVRICQSKLELMSHSFQMQKDIGQIFDLISLAIIN